MITNLPREPSTRSLEVMGVRLPLTTDPEHVDGGLVQPDEHSVVDLPQPEQLEDLLHLGVHLSEGNLHLILRITFFIKCFLNQAGNILLLLLLVWHRWSQLDH